MGYVDIHCPVCGHHASVTDEAAARMARCAVCGAALRQAETSTARETPAIRHLRLTNRPPPPAEPSVPGAKPSLRLDPAGAVGGNVRLCPHCQAVIEREAIICSACGYNTATGRCVQEDHARRERLRRCLAALTVLLILMGVTVAAWHRGWIRLPNLRTWWAFAPTDEITPSSPPPSRSDMEIESLIADLEPTVRAELDQRAPIVQREEVVEVELLTGEVIAGTFWRTKASHIALIMVDGVLREVPHDQMRPASRLRFDALYRDEVIRTEARRRAERFGAR